MNATIETLVELAKRGDKGALEILIRKIQDKVYGLAIRMLYYPADAEDATQEIIVKILLSLAVLDRNANLIPGFIGLHLTIY